MTKIWGIFFLELVNQMSSWHFLFCGLQSTVFFQRVSPAQTILHFTRRRQALQGPTFPDLETVFFLNRHLWALSDTQFEFVLSIHFLTCLRPWSVPETIGEAQMNLEADPVPGFLENWPLYQHFKASATCVCVCMSSATFSPRSTALIWTVTLLDYRQTHI